MNAGKFSSQLHIVGLSWEPHAKFASQRNMYENIMLSKGTESMQDIKHTPAVPAAQKEHNPDATRLNFCFVALSSTLDVDETVEIGSLVNTLVDLSGINGPNDDAPGFIF
jgi:hypothetical protein